MSLRLHLNFKSLIFSALSMIAWGGGGLVRAEESGKILEAFQEQARTILKKCGGAVVRIEATDDHGRLGGTGFFIDPSGTLYTSYGVGGESEDICVTFRGKNYRAERLTSDSRSGVAILKIGAETPFLTFAKGRSIGVASPVIALGYPGEMSLTPSLGTVGGFDLKYGERFFATTHIRANVPVQQGEGGAPLMNTKGEVVGILISMFGSGNASFVLPIEAAEKVRMDFKRFREARPGWVGIQVQGAELAIKGSTARIDEVQAEGPAAKAGLQAGDILLQVGTRKILNPEDVLDASFFLTADDATTVRFSRGGVESKVQVQPVDPPNSLRRSLPAIGAAGKLGLPPVLSVP